MRSFKFDFPPELEAKIQKDLREKGRSSPTFECGFFREGDPTEKLTVKVTNTVAIRPKGYIKATSPAASDEFAAPAAIGKLQELLRKRIVQELDIHGIQDLDETKVEEATRCLAMLGRANADETLADVIDRHDFERILDVLGVAGAGCENSALKRAALWNLVDVHKTGRVSATDFMEFWRRGNESR